MKVVSHDFPNKSGIPASPFSDLLCDIGLSVSGLRKIIMFQRLYTPSKFVHSCLRVPHCNR